MRTVKIFSIILIAGAFVFFGFKFTSARTEDANCHPSAGEPIPAESKGCSFNTIFGEEPSDSHFVYKAP